MNSFNVEKACIKQFYMKKGWNVFDTEKGMLFYKNGYDTDNKDLIDDTSVRSRNGSFVELYNQFLSITNQFFKDNIGELKELQPMNIYNGYKNNSFVSTGLEYYYDYLYNDSNLKYNSTFLMQPAIRFKLDFYSNDNYNKGTKYDYSSIAFNNLSIVYKNDNTNIVDKIENIIDYFSAIKIHASRVNFIVEDKIRYKDNDVNYTAVKFFVDNLEVGEILSFNTKRGNLTEYGFGFERLFSRIINKKYNQLFINDNSYDNKSLLSANLLVVLCMFNNQSINRGAKSKINEIIRNNDKSRLLDLDLVYSNYLYWDKILENTKYDNDFDIVANNYLKLVRRR